MNVTKFFLVCFIGAACSRIFQVAPTKKIFYFGAENYL